VFSIGDAGDTQVYVIADTESGQRDTYSLRKVPAGKEPGPAMRAGVAEMKFLAQNQICK
jgi:hypothetical protein